MVHPILPLRLRAVLWYQGETDWWDADRYACSFPNMIQDWRTKFNSSNGLPFYFVQLAPYNGAPVAVRESQKQALLLPMTGVANAIDLGDRSAPAGDVHPRNKSYVGERLARLVRANVYGEQGVVAEGPQVVSATAVVTGSTFQLTLQFVDDRRASGLYALPTPGCNNRTMTDARSCCMQTSPSMYSGLFWYSFMGANGQMYSLNTTVRIDQATHTITSTQQPAVMPMAGQSVFVSYAYVDWPGCALYNEYRLPALPFQMNVTVIGGSEPAPLRLNNLFSSNMVLQRAPQQAAMWGYGEPGRMVSVRLDNQTAISANISDTGSWSVKLPATEASLGHVIVVSDAASAVTMSNVAFGDVYLCSGQSNMQITLGYSFHAADAIAAASKYPNLRLFSKPLQYATMEQVENKVTYSPDSWVLPAANTLQNPNNAFDFESYFSATCYWTGMHIYDSLNGTIPLGLVQSSYGGSVVDAWTSPDALSKCGPLVPLPAGRYENLPFNYPSVLYNAMVHPLLPMRFTAVLWYQGESDYWDVDRYKCSFPNMIADWRSKFGYPELPFYFVLLAAYNSVDDAVMPGLRIAQLGAWPGTNIGVASAIDLGDKNGTHGEIHPRNKSYVGERLARWVQHDIYNQKEVYPLGPEPLNDPNAISVTVDGTMVKVVLTYPVTESNSGLFMLPSPGCTTCCQGGAGVLLVTINDTSNANAMMQHRPPVSIDQQAHTVTATFNLSYTPSAAATAIVGLEAEAWPQCIMYNRHNLPALPFITAVSINGGGKGGKDEEGTSLWVYVIAAVVVLAVVGVVAWLVVRYMRQRRASAEEAAGGYRNVDERRTGLLSSDSTSPSGSY